MDETIGQQLRRAREARSLSLEQVAQATHMRVHYLQAMESGKFELLPSLTQARGFLRVYANFLNLDAGALLHLLDGQVSPSYPKPEDKTRPVARSARVEPRQEENGRSAEPATTIFREVGQGLRSQRELLGLSLDDVVRHTHLRRHYLEALESGNLEGLPSPVQGRGMLKNYAAFLGLDPEPVLLHFAEGLQARLAVNQAARFDGDVRTRPSRPWRRPLLPARLRRFISSDVLFGVTLAVFLISFVTWGAIRIYSMRSEQPLISTAPSIAEVLLSTETATLSPTPLPVTPSPQSGLAALPAQTESAGGAQVTVPVVGNQAVQVYLSVNQRAWMQVSVDGKIVFQDRVLPGSAYPFAGEKRVEILTGNGAALQVFFNQQDLGALGQFGEVVDRVYTLEGVQTPTPTVTPTEAPTERPSPTPRPSPTARSGTPTVPALP
jgi:cytoskeleton protein RodZ